MPVEPSADTSAQTAPKKGGSRLRSVVGLFQANFMVCLLVLLIRKAVLIAQTANVAGSQSSPGDVALGFAALWGSDVVAAALVALLATATLAALDRHGRASVALVGSVVFQAGHGFFVALSTLLALRVGGPLTKQAVDAFFFQLAEGGSGFEASTSDFLGAGALALLVAGPVLAAVLVLALLRRSQRAVRRILLPRRWRLLATACVLEAMLTLLVVPAVSMASETGREVASEELSTTPALELVGSYGRAWWRSWAEPRKAHARRLTLPSYESPSQQGRSLSTVLTGATPRSSHVVVVLLESTGNFVVDEAMPFLRELRGRSGVISLDQHYTTWTLTAKAIYSILCSEYPFPDFRPITVINPSIACTSLSQVLHARGYRNAFITSQDTSWERQVDFLEGRDFDVVWDRRNLPGREGAWQGPWGIDDRVSVNALLTLMEARRDQPLFALLQFAAGHHPFLAAAEHERQPLEPEQALRRAVGVADARVRDLFEGLAERGLLDDTLIAVVADHGEGVGRHAGRNAYQEAAWVPALITGPQTRGLRGSVEATTSHVDLAPTLLGLLGEHAACSMKGRDLTRPTEHRVAIFGSRPPLFQLGVVDGPTKLILEMQHRRRLFDLTTDPRERYDVAHRFPERADALEDQLLQHAEASAAIIQHYEDHLSERGCSGASTTASRDEIQAPR